MTGSLRIKHKTYYMVFSWKDELGQWRQKSESTGIPERGGKRKAQELLNNRLAELQAQSTAALTVNVLVGKCVGPTSDNYQIMGIDCFYAVPKAVL